MDRFFFIPIGSSTECTEAATLTLRAAAAAAAATAAAALSSLGCLSKEVLELLAADATAGAPTSFEEGPAAVLSTATAFTAANLLERINLSSRLQ